MRFSAACLLVLLVVSSASMSLPMIYAVSEISPGSSSTQCICGPQQVNILLLDFADVRHKPSSTIEEYHRIIAEMNVSIHRQSYGQTWIVDGHVYGWYQTDKELHGLSVTTANVNGQDAMVLKNTALWAVYKLQLKLPGFLFAVFAGDVWAWADTDAGIAILGETWNATVFTHEFAHLIGLRDLSEDSNMGEWDLMSSQGEELCAWSRMNLGWLTSRDFANMTDTRPTVLFIRPIDDLNGTRALVISTASTYVLAEARSRTLVIYLFGGYVKEDAGVGCDVLGCGPIWVYRPSLHVVAELSEESGYKTLGRVFTFKEIHLAIILLEATADGIKIEVANSAEGTEAARALSALETALQSIDNVNSTQRGWLSNMLASTWTQKLSVAREQVSSGLDSFRKGNFGEAEALAEAAQNSTARAKEQTEMLEMIQTVTPIVLVGCVVALLAVAVLRRRKKP